MNNTIITLKSFVNNHDKNEIKKLHSEIINIFLESSSKKEFSSKQEKQSFIYRYLEVYYQNPEHCILAFNPQLNNQLIGYLAGCTQTTTEHFKLNPYLFHFQKTILKDYPSHLHINLSATARGMGTGSKLLAYFEEKIFETQKKGIHVTTLSTEKNVEFYLKNNYQLIITEPHPNVKNLVLLGKEPKSVIN